MSEEQKKIQDLEALLGQAQRVISQQAKALQEQVRQIDQLRQRVIDEVWAQNDRSSAALTIAGLERQVFELRSELMKRK